MPISRRQLGAAAGITALGLAATGATWQIAQGQSNHGGQTPVDRRPDPSTAPTSTPTGPSVSPRDPNAPRPSLITPGAKVLFQGDSITDAGRRGTPADSNDRRALGAGYAWLAASGYLTSRPGHRLAFHNAGRSGDMTVNLASRWGTDTLDLAPDVVSILVGVNDYWNRHRVLGFTGSAEIYHQQLGTLVARTRAALPQTRVVICEPFLLEAGPVRASWQRDFSGYRQAAADIALAHDLRFVGFQAVLDAALDVGPAASWCHDGIHPTPDGAAVLAREWVRVVGQ